MCPLLQDEELAGANPSVHMMCYNSIIKVDVGVSSGNWFGLRSRLFLFCPNIFFILGSIPVGVLEPQEEDAPKRTLWYKPQDL